MISISRPPLKISIREDSELYRHITQGNHYDGIRSFEHPVPTIIDDGRKGKDRIVVFTYVDKDYPVPVVYFYDLNSRRNIAKATGASIFLNSISEGS